MNKRMLYDDNGDFYGKSEIIWSQDENIFFLENDDIEEQYEESSDFTAGTTSSCSWHNDDFDMKSSNKIRQSLEAIDEALYENIKSSIISEELFKECCDWSKKFPHLRLKGDQMLKPCNDSFELHISNQEGTSLQYIDNFSSGLQIVGKKMAIHASSKNVQKKIDDLDATNEVSEFFEEVYEDDGNYEELFALDTMEQHSEFISGKDHKNETSAKYLEEKIIESIALEMFPEVLAILQDCNDHSKSSDKVLELPPISTTNEQKCSSTCRPRTEGTDFSIPDFPKLSSYLTVSPKVLQKKREIGSGRSNLRSSRPSSEIHLNSKSRAIFNPKNSQILQAPELMLKKNAEKEGACIKLANKEERNQDSLTSFPPVLEEEVLNSANTLSRICLESESKESNTNKWLHINSRRHDSFLPPIVSRHNPSFSKINKNLVTCFDTQLKYEDNKRTNSAIFKPRTPASRPTTTGASRKVTKYSSGLHFKNGNESYSTHNFSHSDIKKPKEVEKQVTLFPIVTSLVPNIDRNYNKRGLLYNPTEGKKR